MVKLASPEASLSTVAGAGAALACAAGSAAGAVADDGLGAGGAAATDGAVAAGGADASVALSEHPANTEANKPSDAHTATAEKTGPVRATEGLKGRDKRIMSLSKSPPSVGPCSIIAKPKTPQATATTTPQPRQAMICGTICACTAGAWEPCRPTTASVHRLDRPPAAADHQQRHTPVQAKPEPPFSYFTARTS